MEHLLLNITDTGIANVSLNRPKVHNAFNDDLIKELTDCFEELGQNENVRAIILSGSGKSFSAGADLNWMKAAASYSEEENKADAMRLSNMLNTLNTCPKPVVAIAHGAVMGGGVGLLSCADMVIAVEGTIFALSEVKLGLTPAAISPYVIAAIGARHARRLFMSGERFDTHIALKTGLVHITAENLTDAATAAVDYAHQYLDAAPGAVADAKKLLLDLVGKPITDDLREDTAERIAARRGSAEGKEGLTAFLEKRKPNWVPETES